MVQLAWEAGARARNALEGIKAAVHQSASGYVRKTRMAVATDDADPK